MLLRLLGLLLLLLGCACNEQGKDQGTGDKTELYRRGQMPQTALCKTKIGDQVIHHPVAGKPKRGAAKLR